ncbi:hypothetical protein [Thermoactinomyces mirandus]|uniref:Uncharacterized protein n=1 Tax=Thermoactinomyces mirandus TaxID=2756294 RepID=A0A7W1XQG6_9BACL|nr:hypothetical protein [Thermoactinomyces mirandus]MBA4601306.1 hypothetical protein [Thermoactinomyces mirandus]
MQEGNISAEKLELILSAVQQLAEKQDELKRQIAGIDQRLKELNRIAVKGTNQVMNNVEETTPASIENEAQVYLLDGQMMPLETASFQIQKELLELKRRVRTTEWEPFADSV